MHRIAFRRALALTIALALVISGASWQQCLALQPARAVQSIEHGRQLVPHHEHGAHDRAHDHQASHHRHLAHEAPAAPPADDYGCMKCCAMCMVAHATLPTAFAAVTLTATPGVFFSGRDSWSGNIVRVDPGIPKRIA